MTITGVCWHGQRPLPYGQMQLPSYSNLLAPLRGRHCARCFNQCTIDKKDCALIWPADFNMAG